MRSDQSGQRFKAGEVRAPQSSPVVAVEPLDRELGDESRFELRTLRAADGLSISALPNGCIYAIERGQILINQMLASPLAGGVHRIYLRSHISGSAFASSKSSARAPAARSLRRRIGSYGVARGMR